MLTVESKVPNVASFENIDDCETKELGQCYYCGRIGYVKKDDRWNYMVLKLPLVCDDCYELDMLESMGVKWKREAEQLSKIDCSVPSIN